MATKPKFTHYRARTKEQRGDDRRRSVTLAGRLLNEGEVVAITDLDATDLPESYLPDIEARIIETGNTWPVLEAGTVKDGVFVPLELQAPKEPAKTPAKEPDDEAGQE